MPVQLTGLGSAIATITLDSPARLNAFDRADLADLHAAAGACEADGAVRCVLLRGSGRAFCAGADLGFLAEIRSAPAPVQAEALALAPSLVRRIATLAKPVVAAVQGAAFGGGACLALACDDVVLAPDARLGLIFTNLGLPGGDSAATWLVSRRTGTRRAWQLLAHGAVVSPDEALALGLADQVSGPAGLDDAAGRRAAAYAARPAGALAMTKRQLLRLEGAGTYLDAALDAEVTEMCAAFGGADSKARADAGAELAEGLAAFRERRAPRWPTASPPSPAR